jgi:hypothetical protein
VAEECLYGYLAPVVGQGYGDRARCVSLEGVCELERGGVTGSMWRGDDRLGGRCRHVLRLDERPAGRLAIHSSTALRARNAERNEPSSTSASGCRTCQPLTAGT